MDQQFNPFFCAETIGMECFSDGNNFAVHRADDGFITGNDRNTVADNLLRKHRIRNLIQGNKLTGSRRKNADFFCVTHNTKPPIHFLLFA